MKKLLLGICFIGLNQFVSAQTLQGTIKDQQNGQPVVAATVSVAGQFALTNEVGNYYFSKLLKGDHKIEVSTIGFQNYVGLVKSGTTNFNIQLQRIDLLLAPVEVNATRASEKSPFAKTMIGRKQLEQLNLGQDIPFLLNQTPSVIINSDAGNGVGYTGIRIRGTDATRINMTINGIPYNDAESQGLFFVNLPDFASSVNNIQIQRGVGTSTNGAGAFGATINFSTQEANTTPYATTSNSYGSFNTLKNTVKIGSGIINNHFTIDARMSRINSDGYIDRAFSKLGSLYLSGAYLTEKSSLRFNLITGKEKTYQAWYGLSAADLKTNRKMNTAGAARPGSPYDNETDNYQQDHYQLFYNHQFNKHTTFSTAFFLTQGKGYYEQYKAEQKLSKYGIQNYLFNNGSVLTTDLIRQLWLDNDFYGQVFSLEKQQEKSSLTVGGGWNHYQGHHFGKVIWANIGIPKDHEWYRHLANKKDLNLYSKYQYKIQNNLQAFVDVQYRHIDYSIDGFRDNPTVTVDQQYNFFNPKLGITYTKDHLQWYASYSLGQKEPNRDDFEASTSGLPKPEKLHDFELGVEKKTGRLTGSAGLYYMRYKDQLVLTGKINDVGAYTRTNIPNSYRLGMEMEGKIQLTHNFNLLGGVTLSRNKVLDYTEYYDDYDNGGQQSIKRGTTDIAYAPSIISNTGLNYAPHKNIHIQLTGKYVGLQYLDNSALKDRSLHDYYVQDLQVSYNIPCKIFKELTWIGQANNIFNRKYEPNGYTFSYLYGGSVSTENYYFPMAGTNFMTALIIKF